MVEPEDKPEKKLKPLTRWVVVPVAFSWIGFLLTAPFALADERFAYGGLIFGLLLGLVIAINHPNWISRVERTEVPKDRPRRTNRSLGSSLFFTAVALLFAWLVHWAVQQSTDEKGLLFFVAAFFMISVVRRSLRRAWGFYGSLAGMATSGVLLVALVRASAEETDNKQMLTWMVAVPFILLEAWDEARALKRIEASSGESDTPA